jgi:hypothetical protein
VNLVVFVSISWVKLDDLLDGYLGIYIYIYIYIYPSLLNFSLSNWISCLIKHRMFTSKCEKFGLVKAMASLVL